MPHHPPTRAAGWNDAVANLAKRNKTACTVHAKAITGGASRTQLQENIGLRACWTRKREHTHDNQKYRKNDASKHRALQQAYEMTSISRSMTMRERLESRQTRVTKNGSADTIPRSHLLQSRKSNATKYALISLSVAHQFVTC
jgi:hypothetical protein